MLTKWIVNNLTLSLMAAALLGGVQNAYAEGGNTTPLLLGPIDGLIQNDVSQARAESSIAFRQAVQWAQQARAADKAGRMADAFVLYDQVRERAAEAQIAYTKRGLIDAIPSDIDFLAGAAYVETARIVLVNGYKPVNAVEQFRHSPAVLLTVAQADLRRALATAQKDQTAVPTPARQRQIDAINTTISYANLLQGNLAEAKTGFQTIEAQNANFKASQKIVIKISDALKGVIKNAVKLGVECAKYFLPGFSPVGTALENFVSSVLDYPQETE